MKEWSHQVDQKQQDILHQFTQSLVDLDDLMAKVPKEGLDWAEKEGKWTIRQIIHHLAGDCDVYSFIIKRALATPGSQQVFGEFPGNEVWAKRLKFDQRPIEPARQLMHAHRTFLAELMSSLPECWENTINFHKSSGEKITEQSARQMLIMLTEHMQEHTDTISAILQAHQQPN